MSLNAITGLTSLVQIFTNNPPLLGAFEFDAILEDTLEASVQLTNFPIESGARAADHRIIQPFRWSLIGAMSNNPLQQSFGALAAGALSNVVSDSGLASTVAGISAGLLAGSSESRSSVALQQLIDLMVLNEPFQVLAGDIILENMVIVSITRTKTPDNEQGLIFEAELQELPTLDTVTSGRLAPTQNQLADGDPAKNQAAALVDKGEKGLQAATQSQTAQVGAVL